MNMEDKLALIEDLSDDELRILYDVIIAMKQSRSKEERVWGNTLKRREETMQC